MDVGKHRIKFLFVLVFVVSSLDAGKLRCFNLIANLDHFELVPNKILKLFYYRKFVKLEAKSIFDTAYLPRSAACNLNLDVGELCPGSDESFSFWFYNKTDGGCGKFEYGGCEGNANRFESLKECKAVCSNPYGKGKDRELRPMATFDNKMHNPKIFL